MADYSTLFQLMLGVFVFVIVGVVFIVYLMILSVRGKKKLKAEGSSAIELEFDKKDTAECPHHFGYLSERDQDQPIPDECSRCMKKLDCISEQQPLQKILQSETKEN